MINKVKLMHRLDSSEITATYGTLIVVYCMLFFEVIKTYANIGNVWMSVQRSVYVCHNNRTASFNSILTCGRHSVWALTMQFTCADNRYKRHMMR